MNVIARTYFRTILLWLVCQTFLLPGPAFPSPSQTPPRILIINSYSFGYDWSDQEMTALRERLLAEFPSADLLVEYLDTKNFHRKRHFPYLAELLENKYAGTDLDLVITLDNSALDFALGAVGGYRYS